MVIKQSGHSINLSSILGSVTMPRRAAQVLDPFYPINTTHIFRQSIRVILLHPTHFHSISLFLFSPLSISLFVSHFLIHHFPRLPFSTISTADHLPLARLFSRTAIHFIVCLPSSITFSLLGKAATALAVSDSYNGINLNGRRLLMQSGLAWIKLLHTSFWEFLIEVGLWGVFVGSLTFLPRLLFIYGICSIKFGFRCLLGFLGVPFCLAFAHLLIVGSLAKVLTVLESECCGFKSLVEANNLLTRRRHTALVMALLSNLAFRLVEILFEFRMYRCITLWETSILVSMYSSVLVFDTVMNVVFYYACKA